MSLPTFSFEPYIISCLRYNKNNIDFQKLRRYVTNQRTLCIMTVLTHDFHVPRICQINKINQAVIF